MIATREQLVDAGATIIIDACEGGSCGVASWALSKGTYKWSSENGDYELGERNTGASVTLYNTDDATLTEDEDEADYRGWDGLYKLNNPLPIDAEMVADFIVRFGKGEIDLSQVPKHGRMNDSTLKSLLMMYHGMDDPFADWDCINADQVVQFMLLGEVVYG